MAPLSARCAVANAVTIPQIFSDMAMLSSGSDTIDLGTVENWLIRPELLKLLQSPLALSALSQKDLSYASGVGGDPTVRQALADILNCYFVPAKPVGPEQVVLAAGASGALDALIQQICDPGDKVMIATPYWSGLDISVTVHNQAEVLPVNIPLESETDVTCVKYYREVLARQSEDVKALLICNPTNPTGQCFSRATLESLVGFCEQNNIHLISDEVYALSVLQQTSTELSGATPREFTSVMAIETSYPDIHVIYSLSKDFGCSGFRLGALVSQSSSAIRLGAALALGAQVSCLTSTIVAHILLVPERISFLIDLSRERLREAYNQVLKFCAFYGLFYRPVIAGPFIWVRMADSSSEREDMNLARLFREKGVAVIAGRVCHSVEHGWFRVAFGVAPDNLGEGLKRLGNALLTYRDGENDANKDQALV